MIRYELLLAFSLALLPCADASAEMQQFAVPLTGQSEVPPNPSEGSGLANVVVDTDARTIAWTITAQSLTGDPTAAHFHGPADLGQNAGPVVDISQSIAQGQATLTDQQLADVLAGKVYINIHTAQYPDGELRGQLAK
jgi:CHRD domain